jgi:hypothetical protein
VTAGDAIGTGRARAAPWWIAIELDGQSVTCRFDSVSWAGEMSEADYVYDGGRITGGGGVVLWAPSGFRPRVLGASQGSEGEWGRFEIRPEDPPRRLVVTAGDVAGNVRRREIVLVPPRRDHPPSAPAQADAKREPRVVVLPEWKITSLPERGLAIAIREPRGCRFDRVTLGRTTGRLTASGSRRGAVLRLEEPGTTRLVFEGEETGAAACRAESDPMRLSWLREGAEDGFAGLEWMVPKGALFEPALVVAETLAHVTTPAELSPIGPVFAFHSGELPLRQPIRFRLTLVERVRAEGLALFQQSPEGRWEFLRSVHDSVRGRLEAESRRLGVIAAFRDVMPPRIGSTGARRSAPRRPYSRWALEARLEERGSGVEARETYFEIDGRRVPSEWDGEARTLRWRPRVPPARGQHRYLVIARDRCGNVARRGGTFVLD